MTSPNQFDAIEWPTATPKASPKSWTSALAVLATPDWRCSVASSRIPIVSVMPGRSVTSAASVTTSGEASKPEPNEQSGGEAGRDGRDRSDHRLRPGGSARGEGDRADHEPDERCGARLPPAAAEHGRQCDAGDRVGGEHQRPWTAERGVLDVPSAHERTVRVEPPVERVLDEAVEPRDRVQVDRQSAVREASSVR